MNRDQRRAQRIEDALQEPRFEIHQERQFVLFLPMQTPASFGLLLLDDARIDKALCSDGVSQEQIDAARSAVKEIPELAEATG